MLPFQNPDLSLAARVNDLLHRLTPNERILQLMHEAPAVERLGIPPYGWWNEACHGVARNGRATVFPQGIGLGATFDVALVRRVFEAVAEEARAKHAESLRQGRHGPCRGLTFWTPNINLYRDPRWGRGQETFGEDPHLTGELGAAVVAGLQGDDPERLRTAACAKHFAVHSGPEEKRHAFDARVSARDLHESYLPHFERVVRAGVESVMGAYNRTNGEPCCGSPTLLDSILRGKWGFQGHVVSDCGALDDFHRHHRVTGTAAESAALALRSGCDLNCGW
jgi:beta-glucosidase